MFPHSKNFREFKTQEYFKLMAESILEMRKATSLKATQVQYEKAISEYVLSTNTDLTAKVKLIKDSVKIADAQKIGNQILGKLQITFDKIMADNYVEAIQMGVRHQIYDFIYEYLPSSRKYFDTRVITVPGLDGQRAEFASTKDGYGYRPDRELENSTRYGLTQRAVYNLLDSRKRAKDLGTLEDRAQRLKIADEVSRTVEMLNKISDYSAFSKASEKDFISSNYLKQRKRVLKVNFKQKTDLNIRRSIGDFLAKNREYITNLKSQRGVYSEDLALLKKRVEYFLVEDYKQQIQTSVAMGGTGASGLGRLVNVNTIINTELNIAYNFGKIAGFGKKQSDKYKRFMWNVDREAAQISRYKQVANTGDVNYEVPCVDCSRYDGLEFFLYEIVKNGMAPDDILNYKGGSNKVGGTGTLWRNHNRPSIPFHPNCNCYWTLSDDVEDSPESIAALEKRIKDKRGNNWGGVLTAVGIAAAAVGVIGLIKSGAAQTLGSAVGKAIYKNFGKQPVQDVVDVVRDTTNGLKTLKVLNLPENTRGEILNLVVQELQPINRYIDIAGY